MRPLALVALVFASSCCTQGDASVRLVRSIGLAADPGAAAEAKGRAVCRDVALSSDGLWIVAVLADRVAVASVADGVETTLPIAAADVRAVAAAGVGGDVLLVTATEVQRWDASRAQRRRIWPLPVRTDRTLRVRAARSGGGTLVALRGWFDESEPWVAVLDQDTGCFTEFDFAHGSMDWSPDGNTLFVGTGGPFNACMEAGVVRSIPRGRGFHFEVPTPAYHAVAAVSAQTFLGSDSVADACLVHRQRSTPVPGVIWYGCVALSPDWLLVARDGLLLRTLDGVVVQEVLPDAIDHLVAARAARRAVATDGHDLHVVEWDARLPSPPRKAEERPRNAW